MPVCTSCKHNREIERLRNICAACCGASDNFGGQVYIDAAKDPMLVFRHADRDALAAQRAATASRVNLADEATIELLERVISEFATLTDAEAPVVCRRLRGQENWQIAHEMRVSKARVWSIWDKLKNRNPIWAAIDNGLIGKRKGGRPRETKPQEIVQGDLFSMEGLPTEKQTSNYYEIEHGFDNGKCTTRKGTYRRFKTGDGRKQP